MPLINKLLYKYAETKPTFSGNCAFFGNDDKGWIEIYENGAATFPSNTGKKFDLYLLSNGSDGKTGYSEIQKQDTTGNYIYTSVESGNGGAGGKCVEFYSKSLSGKLDITIGETTYIKQQLRILFTTDNASAIAGGSGGAGQSVYSYTNLLDPKDHKSEHIEATRGGDGRIPFTGHTTLNSGLAQHRLGAGGNGGWYEGTNPDYTETKVNTGAGGNGGKALSSNGNYPGETGGTGIVIIRWGY